MSVSSSVSASRNRRVVLVTGAAKRIGRGLALGFAERGWDVAVHYGESAEEARQVVDEIVALGRRAVALQADLAVEAQVLRLVPACIEALGGLACVVNCASRFDEDVSRAYYAMFHAVRAALAARGVQAKTHSGLAALFAEQLVRTGEIDAELGRWLGQARRNREIGDYDDFLAIDPEEAVEAVSRPSMVCTLRCFAS